MCGVDMDVTDYGYPTIGARNIMSCIGKMCIRDMGRLAAGAAVTVIGEQRGTDGNTWYQIQYTGTGGAVNTGYVSSVYIRLPVAYTKDSNFEAYLTSQGFPESYKNGLRQLHAQYPNWVFKAKNIGLDWNTVIENESVLGLSLIHI